MWVCGCASVGEGARACVGEGVQACVGECARVIVGGEEEGERVSRSGGFRICSGANEQEAALTTHPRTHAIPTHARTHPNAHLADTLAGMLLESERAPAAAPPSTPPTSNRRDSWPASCSGC